MLVAIKWSTGVIKWFTGLPWLDKTAIEWSTGHKMVYGLPSLDKTAIGGDKTAIGGDKTAIGGDKMVYGLPWGLRAAFAQIERPLGR